MGGGRLRDEAFQPARIDCARKGAAASRRAAQRMRRATIEIGKLAIDPASYRVSHSGKPVPLSTLEFRLLYYLASRSEPCFHARPTSGCSLGHRPIRYTDTEHRGAGLLRPPPPRKDRIRSGKSHSLENGSRRGLFVRNPCGLIFSAKLALAFLTLLLVALLGADYSGRTSAKARLRANRIWNSLRSDCSNRPESRAGFLSTVPHHEDRRN